MTWPKGRVNLEHLCIVKHRQCSIKPSTGSQNATCVSAKHPGYRASIGHPNIFPKRARPKPHCGLYTACTIV